MANSASHFFCAKDLRRPHAPSPAWRLSRALRHSSPLTNLAYVSDQDVMDRAILGGSRSKWLPVV
jgi:hypothetical protein